MNPEACCSSSCCYSSLQRTVLNYSRLSLAIRILSKQLPSFFCNNDGLFRKPTSPPLPLREGPPLISVFSPQGRRGNRSSSSLVTISFYGWRTIRGLRQQRSCGLRYATAWTRIAYRVLARCLLLMLSACSMLDAGWLLDARGLLGLVIAAKGYLESFSVNMFLRKRVLPRM